MNIDEKKQIISLLETVKTAIEYANSNVNEDEAELLISDSCDALNSIAVFIKQKDERFDTSCISKLFNELSNFNKLTGENKKKLLIWAEEELEKVIKSILEERKRKLKAVFLPYKVSMWTSLESIWRSANEDPDCEAVVVPIPYHNLDSEKNKVKVCYEGEEYPDYVQMKKFWEYDIAAEKPDMIFIHNPYDSCNTLTRVLEEYYSTNLKKYTKMLVYSPYFTTARYNPNIKQTRCYLPGVINADRVILQNKELKKLYIEHGYKAEKLLALGCPKIDSIREIIKNPLEIPKEWKVKIKDKNVFLLNTTLNFFTQFKGEAFKRIKDVYESVVENNNAFLIWRPHPLTEEWMKNNNEAFLELYEKLIKKLLQSESVLIDNTEDYRIAFSVSQALFSSHSSMINEFMATEKPVYVIDGISDKKTSFVDYEHNYYLGEHDMNEFTQNVVSGEKDMYYYERKKGIERSFENVVEGNAGDNIYKKLKKELLDM